MKIPSSNPNPPIPVTEGGGSVNAKPVELGVTPPVPQAKPGAAGVVDGAVVGGGATRVLAEATRPVAGATLSPAVGEVAAAGGVTAVMNRVAAEGGKDVVIIGFDGTNQDNTGTVIDTAADAFGGGSGGDDLPNVLYYPGVGTEAYHDRFGGAKWTGTIAGNKAKRAVNDAYLKIAALHNENPDVKIVIMGYSRGAAQAAELAAMIDEKGIPKLDSAGVGRDGVGFERYTADEADLLLLVDPVYRMGNPLGFLFGPGDKNWDTDLSATETHAYYADDNNLAGKFLFNNTEFNEDDGAVIRGDYTAHAYPDDSHGEIGSNPAVLDHILGQVREELDEPGNGHGATTTRR